MDKDALVSEILGKPVHGKYDRLRGERRGGGHGFVLIYLMERGGKALPGEICQAMGVSTPRVAVLLRELEMRELIVRTVMPDDRRKVCVTLTDKGRHRAQAKHDQQERFVRRLIDRLSEQDALALPRILDALAALRDEEPEEDARFHH